MAYHDPYLAHLPEMLNGDVLLLEAVVVGHFPELDEVDGGAAADQLLNLLRPKHDQGVGRADRVKAEIESSGIVVKKSIKFSEGAPN